MDSLTDSRRQLRIAIIAIGIIIPFGTIGFMIFEGQNLFDALWTTFITISTIGYGDSYAESTAGRVFTFVLIIVGLSVFAYALQAIFAHFISEAVREVRRKRRTMRIIASLDMHYILCGEGEMVDKTISYLLETNVNNRHRKDEMLRRRVENSLQRYIGGGEKGIRAALRHLIARIDIVLVHIFGTQDSLLDLIVVITTDTAYAQHLRERGVLVIVGDPAAEDILIAAGLEHAQAIMIMLENDTQTLLTVLTAHNTILQHKSHAHSDIYITAATLEDGMSEKILRVGADNVIAPFEVAGQFLNTITLRPTVNDFFHNILYDQHTAEQVIQIYLYPDSRWLGQRLGQLELRLRFEAGVIGLRKPDGTYVYAPNEDYILSEKEILIVVAPAHHVTNVREDCRPGKTTSPILNKWQNTYEPLQPPISERSYSLESAGDAIAQMSEHFVICGSTAVARSAIRNLDPERPFVIISNDSDMTDTLLKRGFRVVHGDPTNEDVLRQAGVDRALAFMVSIYEHADAVLTILSARELSERLLITATAASDDMISKLRQAGADRVVSPFQIAAQSVLMATTRPAVTDFMHYVIFNYSTGLETTELYMQDDSPWIGKSIDDLRLEGIFRAGVIGLRTAQGKYIYAPPCSHIISAHEILIITTPMENADELRTIAHGSANKRPKTLRRESILRNYR